MEEKLNAFVLIPFDDEFKPLYEKVIYQTLNDEGYNVRRADSFIDQRNILNDIIEGIVTANLIIADLTTLNPNVMYELGISHGLRIPTVLITQSVEELPFDLRGYRIIEYSTQFDEIDILKDKLKEIAIIHKEGGLKFGSPVTDYLEADKITDIDKREDETTVMEEEKGYYDSIFDGITGMEKLSELLNNITEETNILTVNLENHSKKLISLSNQKSPGAAKEIYKEINFTAADMNKYSNNMKEKVIDFENIADQVIDDFSSIINWYDPKSEEDVIAYRNFRETLEQLYNVSKSSIESTNNFRYEVINVKNMNISRSINQSAKGIINILDRLISFTKKIEGFCARSVRLMREKLEKK